MNKTVEKMKQLKFGTELEYTNISREKAAKAIHRKARADTALVLSSRTGMMGGASGRSRNAVNMLTTLSVTIAAPIKA